MTSDRVSTSQREAGGRGRVGVYLRIVHALARPQHERRPFAGASLRRFGFLKFVSGRDCAIFARYLCTTAMLFRAPKRRKRMYLCVYLGARRKKDVSFQYVPIWRMVIREKDHFSFYDSAILNSRQSAF